MGKETCGNVVLIGFMGSGKSSMGIRLSYRMRYVLEDTDKLIEAGAGKTISEIFAQEGEEAFRAMETALLEKLVEKKGQRIYSVGGRHARQGCQPSPAEKAGDGGVSPHKARNHI